MSPTPKFKKISKAYEEERQSLYYIHLFNLYIKSVTCIIWYLINLEMKKLYTMQEMQLLFNVFQVHTPAS